jgi:hypothetical protein
MRGVGNVVAHQQSNEMPRERRLIVVKVYGPDDLGPIRNGSTEVIDQLQLIRSFDLSRRRQTPQISFDRSTFCYVPDSTCAAPA